MARRQGGTGPRSPAGGVRLWLDAEPPLDWRGLLAFLGARAVPGVEEVRGEEYRRVVVRGDAVGTLVVRPDAAGGAALWAELSSGLTPHAAPLVPALRRLFDLDACPAVIAEHLGKDPALAPHVRARPGLRVPGALDLFELVCRAVLGQQVSVQAATTLAGRLAARWGARLAARERNELVARRPDSTLSTRFPTPRALAAAEPHELAGIGLPRQRAATLGQVAKAFCDGALAQPARLSDDELVAALRALPGIGPWTASYVLLRARGAGDVFLSGDLVLRKALGGLSAKAAEERALPWRPWRSYAAMQLWAAAAAARTR